MFGIFEGARVELHGRPGGGVFAPKWLDPKMAGGWIRSVRQVHLYQNFMEAARDRKPQSIVFYRTYALGDILMLLPIISAVHSILGLNAPITIVSEQRFIDAFRHARDARWRMVRKCGAGLFEDYGGDIHINLNAVVERDKLGGWESEHHRVKLFAKWLGFEVTT